MSKRSVKGDGTTTVHGKDGKIKVNLPAECKTPPTSVSTTAKAEKKAKILQLRGETRKAALTIRDMYPSVEYKAPLVRLTCTHHPAYLL